MRFATRRQPTCDESEFSYSVEKVDGGDAPTCNEHGVYRREAQRTSDCEALDWGTSKRTRITSGDRKGATNDRDEQTYGVYQPHVAFRPVTF